MMVSTANNLIQSSGAGGSRTTRINTYIGNILLQLRYILPDCPLLCGDVGNLDVDQCIYLRLMRIASRSRSVNEKILDEGSRFPL
jgi:hypothetical protein